jgi:hypothetical protein
MGQPKLKLTDEQMAAIRQMWAAGESILDIAIAVGVSETVINRLELPTRKRQKSGHRRSPH